MTTTLLRGGGKAWFVRIRKRRSCGLRPVSTEGRLLTAAYAAFVSGVTWFLVDADPRAALLAVWLALVAAATFLYILTALRMSAPASAADKGSGGCC